MAAGYVRSYWNPFESGEFSSQCKGWGRRYTAEDDLHPGRVDRNASCMVNADRSFRELHVCVEQLLEYASHFHY